jgi:hypothetical protein
VQLILAKLGRLYGALGCRDGRHWAGHHWHWAGTGHATIDSICTVPLFSVSHLMPLRALTGCNITEQWRLCPVDEANCLFDHHSASPWIRLYWLRSAGSIRLAALPAGRVNVTFVMIASVLSSWCHHSSQQRAKHLVKLVKLLSVERSQCNLSSRAQESPSVSPT